MNKRKLIKINNKVTYVEIGYWDKNGKPRILGFGDSKGKEVFAVNVQTRTNEDYAYRHIDLKKKR